MRTLTPLGEDRIARSKIARARHPGSNVKLRQSPSVVAIAGAPGDGSLESEIAEIDRLPLDDLRLRWRNVTGRLAPAHLARSLLARLLAYRLQAKTFGDLDRKSARALERWSESFADGANSGDADLHEDADPAQEASATKRRAPELLILRRGTLLTREWNGRMETVMVVADGFAWNGATFASLSAVAKAITRTKWNGHRFFGVRAKDRAAYDAKSTAVRSDGIIGHDKAPTLGERRIRGRSTAKSVTAAFPGGAAR